MIRQDLAECGILTKHYEVGGFEPRVASLRALNEQMRYIQAK